MILPRKNEKDLRDIPEEIRKQMKLVLVDSMDQVLEPALRRKPKRARGRAGRGRRRATALDPSRAKQRPTVRRSNFPPTDQPPAVVEGQ